MSNILFPHIDRPGAIDYPPLDTTLRRGVMAHRYVEAGPLSLFKPGKGRTVRLEGVAVAIWNLDGHLCATSDACPHEGVSLGTGGRLDGPTITCGFHYWTFNAATGASEDGFEECLHSYPIELRGESVWVGLPTRPT